MNRLEGMKLVIVIIALEIIQFKKKIVSCCFAVKRLSSLSDRIKNYYLLVKEI